MKAFSAVKMFLRSLFRFMTISCTIFSTANGIAFAQNGVLSHLSRSIPSPNAEFLSPLQIAIIDNDDRRDERQFAAENGTSVDLVNKRYAATGKLVCSNGVGAEATANLVLTSNVIVTAAHVFRGVHCEAIVAPTSCTFSTKVGGVIKRSRVQSLVKTGSACPATLKNPTDWAVLKLVSNIDGVIPYSVHRGVGNMIESGQVLTAVNAMNSDYFVNGKNNDTVKTLGHCKSRKIFRPYDIETGILTDCDGSKGSSGGGIFIDNASVPVLVGIRHGSDETAEQLSQARQKGSANYRDYNDNTWAGIYVPLRGELLRTILNASGE